MLLSALINLAMGSASAKWAIMAPVFIPMFMLLGYSPELVQATYRVGDSVTNVISPLMSYFPLVVAFMKRYDDKAGIGTVVATMLPYSVVFFVVWTVLLMVWLLIGLPLGRERRCSSGGSLSEDRSKCSGGQQAGAFLPPPDFFTDGDPFGYHAGLGSASGRVRWSIYRRSCVMEPSAGLNVEPLRVPVVDRIHSLDQFRGYTVLGMFFVNFIGYFAVTPAIFKHHNTYCSYADTIMPQFFFAVGFAYRLHVLAAYGADAPGLALSFAS